MGVYYKCVWEADFQPLLLRFYYSSQTSYGSGSVWPLWTSTYWEPFCSSQGSRAEVLLIRYRGTTIRAQQWKELVRVSISKLQASRGPVTSYVFLSPDKNISNVKLLPSHQLTRQQGQRKGAAPGFLSIVSFLYHIKKIDPPKASTQCHISKWQDGKLTSIMHKTTYK